MENQLVKLPAEVEQLAKGVTVEKRNEVQSVLNHVFNGVSSMREQLDTVAVKDENDTAESTTGATVKNMVDTYPDDWQLVEEKQEKRPIMTYLILSAMMLLYLYAGLAEINWPLIPATILGFYLLIKNERNGRKKIL